MALYNIERPMTFDEVLGQDKNVKIFRQILTSGVMPNAFLFIGVRGTGKTSSARLFERALNCEHPKEDGSPCNECASCKEILEGNSMDVIELDAASHGGVDDVHEVLKMVQYTPIHKKKILVLDEVHMLSNAAFNALLKTIEEPPANVVFIFCTTEEHKVPATIVSRCRRFVFERISDDVIEGKLTEICKKNNVTFEEEALGIIARAAKGGMRDALSILEQFMQSDITVSQVKETLGIADEDAIFSILSAVAEGNVVNAVSVLRELIKRGKNLEVLLKSLIDGIIDAVYTMQTGKKVSNTQTYLNGIDKFISSVVSPSKALSFVDQLSKVYEVSRKDADMSFALEMTLMKMVDYTSELEELKKRVSILETEGVQIVADKAQSFSEMAADSVTEEADEEVLTPSLGMPITIDDAEFEETKPQESEATVSEPDNVIPFDNEIPLDVPFDMEGFEQGEDISLSALLDDEVADANADNSAKEEETEPKNEVEQEVIAEDSQEEEESIFADFFNLGGARQY